MDPRDQTFMTIHNLTPEANILFASDSILDILGYQPEEVKGKSCFDYFHPDEIPFARSVHSRGILLDKAAVLHYARILSKSGQWVSCECCFTIVHNVLVASTSIYFKSEKSERRARDAPQIRRIFSCSPRDPRYHMLEHLSPKFKMPPMEREPRAALILNRFTRSLNIMYATDVVTQILGLSPGDLVDRPFYDCIQPNCLEEAERCLESAKANESIAYLRFWYKDPRVDLNDTDNEEEEVDESDDESDQSSSSSETQSEVDFKEPQSGYDGMDVDGDHGPEPGAAAEDMGGGRSGERPGSRSRVGSLNGSTRDPQVPQTFELEAVVSCTSDGLVVVLRRARPPIPDPQPTVAPAAINYENGLFAAPWGYRPIKPYISPELLYTFRPPLLPEYMPLREGIKAAGGPPLDQLMRSIRDVAVFAWAVTGINGTLATYGHGRPRMGAQPADGLPIWQPDSGSTVYQSPRDRTSSLGAGTESPEELFENDGAYDCGIVYQPGETSTHVYPRPRHASLDEQMYEGGHTSWHQARPAESYNYGDNDAEHYRHPLRPVFSYDTLHGHGRRHQAYPPPSQAMPGRCNAGQASWTGLLSSRTRISSYGVAPYPRLPSRPEASNRWGHSYR
ncbi:hypothetical protein N656DRAFT_710423 [Canariomyces notabilis]|uniref:PAS domain-containing protein n=1 Tax=Canariomyces notabilis TaxID=2074819 RepID=A0AAN6TDL3_9PEZI|nr:hypothetical protein N656DRAFT_710423 [Canariomyces arenarius]